MVSVIGATIFKVVVDETDRKKKPTIFNRVFIPELRNSLQAAWRLIFLDDALRRSVIMASLQNVLVFVSGTVATVQYRAPISFTVFGGVPLFTIGCGALAGATLAGKLKKRFDALDMLLTTLALSTALIIGQAIFAPGVWTLVVVFLVGINGAITAVCAWDIRLERSSSSNIGSVAGLTGTLYKVPSILILPLVASFGARFGSTTALYSSVFVVCILFLLSFFIRPLATNKIN